MDKKDKNPIIAHIPKSKFTYPQSCYSFIVRFNEVASVAEIYFPPEVAIAADFNAWLTKHKFRLNEDNPQLYTSRLCAYGKRKIVEELLEKARDNGAYQVESAATVDLIGNRSVDESAVEPKIDLASTIADKINILVAQKLEPIINQNQEAIALYEKKIASLIEEIAAKDAEIKELKRVKQKQKQKLTNLAEYERLLGVAKPLKSPFDFTPLDDLEPVDISHLNSPFKGGDMEILDPDDYDETGYNENIAPAKLDKEEKDREISLSDINLELNEDLGLNFSPSKIEQSKEIDLNKVLAEITSGNSKASSNNGKAQKK